MASAFSITGSFAMRARPLQQTLRRLSYTARNTSRHVSAPLAGIVTRLQHDIHPRSTRAFDFSPAFTSSRSFSSATSEPQYSIGDLADDDYHTITDECMERMVEYFEDIGDDHDIPGYDVEYQSGVMTLKLGDKGTYVVNKQPPNKQLWLSSPLTGPKRYDYDLKHKIWFYNRDHHSLKYLLDTEISEALGFKIDVPLDGLGHE
ncbi:Mitochondrial chaperone Frataxin [Dissophora globulifera]|uniref:ferroxidase n=1 Tax=Dissophora globulifera TaxID=979702 RepID=A0A9P6RZC7_9FUNG|nr:Mitochondrial chaperone Frataxin [Dissophora globulifera]